MSGGTPPGGVFIDLGEGHGEVAPPPWSPARVVDRFRSALFGLRRGIAGIGAARTAALALIAVLALSAGGAAVLPGPPLRLVMRLPLYDGSAVLVDGDRMVVLDGTPAVSVYGLRDGSLIARTVTGVPGTYRQMTASDGVALIGGGSGEAPGTYALDEGTGRLLWTSPYDLYAPLPGTGTVLLESAAATDLQLVDVRTGGIRWSMSAAGCRMVLDQAAGSATAAHLALLCANGYLDMVALPGGAVRQVPGPADGTLGPDIDAQFLAAGPMLVVERFGDAAAPTIAAYRWSDGSLAWTHASLGEGDTLAACGHDVCVAGNGRGLALDPASGTEVSPPGAIGPGPVGSVSFIDPGVVVLVPAGRAAPDEPGAYPLPVLPSGTSLLLRTSRKPLASASVVTASSRFGTPAPVLVEIVTAAGSVRPLQRVPGIDPLTCSAVGTYLICPTAGGEGTVWQFRA